MNAPNELADVQRIGAISARVIEHDKIGYVKLGVRGLPGPGEVVSGYMNRDAAFDMLLKINAHDLLVDALQKMLDTFAIRWGYNIGQSLAIEAAEDALKRAGAKR